MITICTSGKDENAQDTPLPFVIDCTPEEPTVGFAGHVASPAPFVVDIPLESRTRTTRSPGPMKEASGASSNNLVSWGSEPHWEALLRVLTAAQVPKETPPDRIEETVGSIFSNTILFSNDKLPSEGWTHSRALHIVCKYVGPCSFSITFQVLDIPNAFSLLLGRPWIHSAGAVPSSLHQRLKFIVEEKLITVKGEEDYAIYKETAVPYISVGDDENLPFHSLETISVIRNYGEIGPSRADRMIGKVLLRNNYIPGTGLGAHGQGISRPIEIEEGIPVPPLSHFFPKPSHTIGRTLDGPSSDSDDTPAAPSAVYAVTEETPSGVHIRLAQEIEELDNWTSVPRYSAVIADV
ncbi:hypothetical protein CRG98_007153 [Punica granatum]|uniref:G-patch domain-containing protein n=1 Tax=Punica granatum TaxID=22663 RepID=A0A2I0KVS0_PUNGR|nr:hypothetical protein CRG98_007153 [Punica granatum]